MYLDFCDIGWDEDAWHDYSEWADALDLTPFRVGQLIGNEQGWEDGEEYELMRDALKYLADKERREIFIAVKAGFGDELSLYKSLLWSTISPSERDESDDDEGFEEDSEPMPLFESRLFSWILDGCPPQ